LIRRAFWIALGLGAGVATAVLASRWMQRRSEQVRQAPAAIGRQAREGATDLGRLFREAADAARRAAAEREAELRESLDLPAEGA
jgi:hypothetical protein